MENTQANLDRVVLNIKEKSTSLLMN